ncbi:hypothetical protein MPH_02143 [Macrophomina phaseolina MS6]|uniref:Uncharacterized protein n=1 Tax=Macrophomina phaseolina (strain MS6) TaxID=1126212 RepID=K2RDM6_MACPH|nr:hypothetical protein MPH_02143 [Macrophomina phaseolina MS6]
MELKTKRRKGRKEKVSKAVVADTVKSLKLKVEVAVRRRPIVESLLWWRAVDTALYTGWGRVGLIGRQSLLSFARVLDWFSAACMSWCVVVVAAQAGRETEKKNPWHKFGNVDSSFCLGGRWSVDGVCSAIDVLSPLLSTLPPCSRPVSPHDMSLFAKAKEPLRTWSIVHQCTCSAPVECRAGSSIHGPLCCFPLIAQPDKDRSPEQARTARYSGVRGVDCHSGDAVRSILYPIGPGQPHDRETRRRWVKIFCMGWLASFVRLACMMPGATGKRVQWPWIWFSCQLRAPEYPDITSTHAFAARP